MFWLEKNVGARVKTIGVALSKTHPREGVSRAISHRDFVANELYQDSHQFSEE
jgi:hypothetical protein